MGQQMVELDEKPELVEATETGNGQVRVMQNNREGLSGSDRQKVKARESKSDRRGVGFGPVKVGQAKNTERKELQLSEDQIQAAKPVSQFVLCQDKYKLRTKAVKQRAKLRSAPYTQQITRLLQPALSNHSVHSSQLPQQMIGSLDCKRPGGWNTENSIASNIHT
ncbi:hypothetical protein AMECASPLE_019935, partial [Ameca splendens]